MSLVSRTITCFAAPANFTSAPAATPQDLMGVSAPLPVRRRKGSEQARPKAVHRPEAAESRSRSPESAEECEAAESRSRWLEDAEESEAA